MTADRTLTETLPALDWQEPPHTDWVIEKAAENLLPDSLDRLELTREQWQHEVFALWMAGTQDVLICSPSLEAWPLVLRSQHEAADHWLHASPTRRLRILLNQEPGHDPLQARAWQLFQGYSDRVEVRIDAVTQPALPDAIIADRLLMLRRIEHQRVLRERSDAVKAFAEMLQERWDGACQISLLGKLGL